jgi:hypothetical protein
MTETTARQKFSCPACGGEAQWNPDKQALICPYCSTVSPAQMELTATGEQIIREYDLAAALRAIPADQRGWQAAKTQVRCQHCNAISVFDPERVAQRCDFCGASALVPYEQMNEAISPESLLPMRVGEHQIRDSMRTWYGHRWFAPNNLKSRALTDTVRGIYIPYWTFDAQVHADWTAESGYYYWETETYRDSQGRTQTRPVRKIRWEPSSGSLNHFFDDELIPASRGVHMHLLRDVEPFPTKDLTLYNPGFLSGWVVERYQIDLVSAAQHSRAQMDAKVKAMCADQVPGDTHRFLNVDADYSRQTFKHILVPIWLLSYTYGRKAYQVVANGYTGEIAGEYPKSWIKIMLAVIAGIILAGIIGFLVGQSR